VCCPVPDFYGNVSLELKMNASLNAKWWTVSDVSNNSDCPNKCLWMMSFNQRIAPSSLLSMATSYGYQTMLHYKHVNSD